MQKSLWFSLGSAMFNFGGNENEAVRDIRVVTKQIQTLQVLKTTLI